jgi:hypothetical protein
MRKHKGIIKKKLVYGVGINDALESLQEFGELYSLEGNILVKS